MIPCVSNVNISTREVLGKVISGERYIMVEEGQISWVDCVALSSVLFSAAYGDKVTVYITKRLS